MQNQKLFSTKSCGEVFSIMMAIYVLLATFCQIVLEIFFNKNSTPYIAVNSLFSIIAIWSSIFIIKRLTQQNVFSCITIKRTNILNYFTAIVLCCGVFFCFGKLNDIIYNFFSSIGLKVNTIKIPLNNTGELVLFSILMAIMPAITEECFFRGVILNGLLNSGRRIVSVVFSALFFAIFHGSITQLVYQFVFGIALSIIAIQSKSILPCIFVHYLNNQVVILFTYFNLSIDLFNIIYIVLGVVFIVISMLYFILPNRKKVKAEVGEEKIKSFFIPYGILGVVICLILIIGGLFI